MTVVALLVATGSPQSASSVADAACWVDIDGRPLVWHAIHRLRDAGVDRVVLVSDSAGAATVARDAAFAGALAAVTSDLAEGFAAALAADPVVVLVHDATRAFAPISMVRRVVDAVRGGAAVVVPVLPVVDTIRAAGTDGGASALVDRDNLRIVQTPQGFAPHVLRRCAMALVPASPSDADRVTPDAAAALAAAGVALTTVAGHADAARVLSAGDIDQARRALGTAVLRPGADRRIDARG